MSYNDKHVTSAHDRIFPHYIWFCSDAKDGDFQKERLLGDRATPATQILFEMKGEKVSATMQYFGFADPITNERTFHGTEDVTTIFADAAKQRGADISDPMIRMFKNWCEKHQEMEHDSKVSTGESREPLQEDHWVFRTRVSDMQRNEIREFKRLSPIEGVSTNLRFVQHDIDDDTEVTLHYLRKDESTKEIYDITISCTEEFKTMPLDKFLDWIEAIHDLWIRKEIGRREELAANKSSGLRQERRQGQDLGQGPVPGRRSNRSPVGASRALGARRSTSIVQAPDRAWPCRNHRENPVDRVPVRT